MQQIFLLSLVLILFLSSCTEKVKDEPVIINPGAKSIYISNEGAFGFNNASLSVYYPQEDILENNVFKSVNGRVLGDVLQSVYHFNDILYLVVNVSSKIEIADAKTFEEKGVILNIISPRYMQIIDNKAYVSCWGDGGQIAVIDLQDNSIVKKIDVGNGPEKMISNQSNLIVCNSGGLTVDSTISIIDLVSNKVSKTLNVGDVPTDIKFHPDSNSFYVLCKGRALYDASWNVIGHTSSKMVKVSSSTFEIEAEVILFADKHPSNLAYNAKEDVFYLGGGYGFQGVYRFEIFQEKLYNTVISTKSFYGISSDSEGKLYGFESPDFSSQGKMVIMDSQGNILKEKKVGVGPNGMIE